MRGSIRLFALTLVVAMALQSTLSAQESASASTRARMHAAVTLPLLNSPQKPLANTASNIGAHSNQFFALPGTSHSGDFIASGPGYLLTLNKGSFSVVSRHAVSSPREQQRPQAASTGSPRELNRSFIVERESVEFLGANPAVKGEGIDLASAYANFLLGNDPSQWRAHLPGYSRVRYASLYPGIDLVYHGELHHQLEYDLVVAPGADPQQIRLRISGDQQAHIAEDGSLQLSKNDALVRLQPPVLYQDIPGGKRIIPGGYTQLAQNEFGFRLADYDKTRPLIIDPTINLLYSTYLGGIHEDDSYDLVLDAAGNTYIGGRSASQDFPVSANAYQLTRQNIGTYTYDGFVMKFDASGSLLYSTFLGGSDNDAVNSLALDAAGNAYLIGTTSSNNFPVTSNALQKTYNGGGSDAFLAELSSDGSQLIYSTYLGTTGNDSAGVIKADAKGAFIIAGSSGASGLPTTTGVYQKANTGQANLFFGRVEFPQGALKIDQLTYFGGSQAIDPGIVFDLAIDSSDNLYFAGQVEESTFPVSSNALIKSFTSSGGCYVSSTPWTTGFITKMSSDLSKMLYSSYFGGQTEATQNTHEQVGCAQRVLAMHVDSNNQIYLIGNTSESDFPVTANALRSKLNGDGGAGFDEFVSILSADGTKLVYSTYLGGTNFEYSDTAAWDANNNIWIYGATDSTDYPVTSDALQSASGGATDASLTELSPDGTKILYSTYFGGSGNENQTGARIGIDASGTFHLSGSTSSTNFAVTPSAFQSAFANGETNPDGTDVYFTLLGTGTIGNIGPVIGGDGGDTTVTISGAGFTTGLTCELVQGSTIISATLATVNAGGTSVSCTFPLSGAAAGAYDVVLKNPDGATFTKQGAFTVQSGGAPNLSVSIVGRPIIRTGSPSTFFVNVTNSGTQDAYLVPLWISLPSSVTYAVNGLTAAQSLALAQVSSNTAYINLFGGDVPAGKTISVPVQITSTSDAASIPIKASVQAPWFGSTADAIADSNATSISGGCVAGSNSYIQNCEGAYLYYLQGGQVPLASVIGSSLNSYQPFSPAALVAQPYEEDNCVKPDAYKDGQEAGIKKGKASLTTLDGFNSAGQPPDNPYPKNTPNYWLYNAGYYFGFTIGVMEGISGGAHSQPALTAKPNDDACYPKLPKPTPPPTLPPPAGSNPPSGGSIDPNYKSGPSGDGSTSAYVRATTALTYSVGFENEPAALLPAAQVVVTDQLDPTKVDLSTLTLGGIGFGKNAITLPTGANNYNTTYNLNSSLSVRIQGSLNTDTGLLKWTFTSIDPSTGLPPSDPTVGFLPPDSDGIVGQGVVQFSVMSKSGLTTGTAIKNQAKVVFDTNAPILTPTWLNTIDADLPVSKVAALPAAQPTSAQTLAFTVKWSGTDKGSGLGTYSVYVSDNGSAFALWQQAVTATSASFTGTVGHTYGFYSIATDAAGNPEVAKTKADATTTVTPPAPLASTTTLTASSVSAASGSSVTLTATVAPPSGSSIVPTGTVTFLDGGVTLGTGTLNASGKATYTTTALPVGTDSITAKYAGDAVYTASTSSALTITIGNPSFTLAFDPSTLSVASGGTGQAALTATSTFGFSSAITFACSGLPVYSTCSFSPSSVTPTVSTPGKTTLTIATNVTAANASVRLIEQARGPSGVIASLGLLIWGALFTRRRLATRRAGCLFLLVFFAGAFAMLSGCGGGSSHKTPKGSSTVTVTATGGSTTQTATIQLTVN